MKIKYVIGFVYDSDRVVLVRKNRPDWQKGLLNGVGGHIEQDEPPMVAMEREFLEEAGVRNQVWHEFCVMNYPDAIVYCFTSLWGLRTINSLTDEKVGWFNISDLNTSISYLTIPNLIWLVPMGKLWFEEGWLLKAMVKYKVGRRNS